MTHIEQMIQDMCPNGVEFKTLGEVTRTLPKGTLKTTDLTEDGYPVINSGKSLYGYYSNFNNECEAITIAARGEYAGWISYFNEKFWAGGLCYPYTSKDENIVKTKFIYYWLKKQECNIMDNLVARGSIPALNKSDLDKFPIPLPPIEIQKKIVECLDKFSALAAELQAELQLRRKQYEYYRTQLLTPHSDCNSADNTDDAQWEWKYLVDVATVQYGYPFEAEKFTDDESYIPLIRIRDVMPAQASTYYEGTYPPEYIVKKGDILVGMDGNFNLEKWNDRDGLLNQRVCKISTKDNNIILNDYLYHYLRPEFKKIENEIKGGTVKHLSAARIKQIMIPVPPINEQCKIAEALNLFTKIIQDMEEGIPAEQAAQQKRYEYYRDLLLTFDRKAV